MAVGNTVQVAEHSKRIFLVETESATDRLHTRDVGWSPHRPAMSGRFPRHSMHTCCLVYVGRNGPNFAKTRRAIQWRTARLAAPVDTGDTWSDTAFGSCAGPQRLRGIRPEMRASWRSEEHTS